MKNKHRRGHSKPGGEPYFFIIVVIYLYIILEKGAQKSPVKSVFFFQYIGPSAPLILVYFGQKFETDITEPKIMILRPGQV